MRTERIQVLIGTFVGSVFGSLTFAIMMPGPMWATIGFVVSCTTTYVIVVHWGVVLLNMKTLFVSIQALGLKSWRNLCGTLTKFRQLPTQLRTWRLQRKQAWREFRANLNQWWGVPRNHREALRRMAFITIAVLHIPLFYYVFGWTILGSVFIALFNLGLMTDHHSTICTRVPEALVEHIGVHKLRGYLQRRQRELFDARGSTRYFFYSADAAIRYVLAWWIPLGLMLATAVFAVVAISLLFVVCAVVFLWGMVRGIFGVLLRLTPWALRNTLAITGTVLYAVQPWPDGKAIWPVVLACGVLSSFVCLVFIRIEGWVQHSEWSREPFLSDRTWRAYKNTIRRAFSGIGWLSDVTYAGIKL